MIPALIIPTLNQTERLQRLLDSIDHPIDRLVIIDNGVAWRGWELRDQVVDPLLIDCDVEHVHHIPMPANLGVAGSWNLGIKATPFAPWWLIANDDITFPSGTLAEWETAAGPDRLVLTTGRPSWCCFALGERVVSDVGLFDERFHPAYFEDDDYERRARLAGHPPHTGPYADHDNSSTIESGVGRNHVTFHDNARFAQHKQATNDLTAGWDLTRRRTLAWED